MNKESQSNFHKDQGNKETKLGFPSPALLMSLAALVLIAAVTLLLPRNSAPSPAPGAGTEQSEPAGAGTQVKVAEGCELLQTLSYTRCEHTVTRRVAAPAELYGKTLAEVEPLYDEWQITEFASKEIKMSQKPDLYCSDHVVLLPNEAGILCVFQNKYGDAMALVSELETELSALPASMQEEVRQGLGFNSLVELEQWLEGAES